MRELDGLPVLVTLVGGDEHRERVTVEGDDFPIEGIELAAGEGDEDIVAVFEDGVNGLDVVSHEGV